MRLPTAWVSLALIAAGAAPAAAEESSLSWDVDGYYRARLVSVSGLPRKNTDFLALDRRDLSASADFSVMRLRLEPTLRYGPDPKKPIAALHVTIDALDNVIFGDNDLIADTPVFGDVLSSTDIDGRDVDTVFLRRAWLELLTPVGQLRVGRMGTQLGLGLLAHAGNGIEGDFGDALRSSDNDRVLFATQPLTIYNALVHGDSRPTPLVLAVAWDKIVEDPTTESFDPRHDPMSTPRSNLPFWPQSDVEDDVNQIVVALVWKDEKFNRAVEADELTIGAFLTYRWQPSTESKVPIWDAYWKLRWHAFGPDRPALLTEGEVLTIQGTTRAISAGTVTEPDIWGAVARLGATTPSWDGVLEFGYASGDAVIADADFTGRALHPNHRVGLLMFPVVLNARTANQFTDNRTLWSKGGVANAKYWYPHARWRPLDGVELVGAFLLSWADTLAPALGGSLRDDGSTDCGMFTGDCFLGWEADAAVKVSWGPDDLVRWSTEGGVMKAGKALETVLTEDLIWTLQSRIAMVF